VRQRIASNGTIRALGMPGSVDSLLPHETIGSKLLIDWLGRLPVSGRAQNADPLGKGDKFRQG
jgi:hypothetical protein